MPDASSWSGGHRRRSHGRTSDALSSDVDRAVSSIVRPLLEGIWQLLPTVVPLIAVLLLSAVAGYFFKDGAAMWR